jgi:hypothetical protein
MATWHQLKAEQRNGPIDLRGETGWTVVTDPPNGCRSSMTGFASREDAQAYVDRCEGFRPGESRQCYILAPKGKG